MPDVHPRLRKHLARCTLDCGFKTPESPALRGFVGGPWALATAALYLVLKSNGLLYPKIQLKKFDFSSKTVPANIAKKLSSQRCSKPPFIAFSTSRTNGPRSLSQVKAGTHSPSSTGSHTRAYTAKQGPSLPRPQHGLELPAKFLLFHRAFIYIHFPVLCELPLSATDLSQTIFHRVFQLLSQTPHVRFHERTWVHTQLCSKDRTQRLTGRNRGRFGWGRYYYPRSVPHVHQHPRSGYQNGVLCRFWVLAGCAPEERRKPSGQRCAYACRCSEGVAAPLGCVIFLQFGDVAVFSLCAQYFLNVRGRGVLLPSACFTCC